MTKCMTIVKKSIVAIASASLILFLTDRLGYALRPAGLENEIAAIKTFHEMPENSVEVMIYGSSHAWKGTDPRVMYKESGIGAYNYGNNWQHLETTLLFMKDSLLTQHPKIALVEIHTNKNYAAEEMDGEIYYTRELDVGLKEKVKYIRECMGDGLGFTERYISYFFPLVAFHGNIKNFSVENLKKIEATDELRTAFGYAASTQNKKISLFSEKTVSKELTQRSLEIMEEMTKLCRENNIELIFYTAPCVSSKDLTDAINEFADAHECTYINFQKLYDDINIDPDKDFRDTGHLNDYGAEKVSKYLAKYLSTHYDLTDYRLGPDNLWQECINAAR